MEIIIAIAIIKYLFATITIILMMVASHFLEDSKCENITTIAPIVSTIVMLLLSLIEIFLL